MNFELNDTECNTVPAEAYFDPMWRAETRKRLHIYFNGCCAYCGRTLSLEVNRWNTLTIEHVTPRARKIDNSDNNLVPACSDCNNAKSDRSLLSLLRDGWRPGEKVQRKGRKYIEMEIQKEEQAHRLFEMAKTKREEKQLRRMYRAKVEAKRSIGM